jgi:hypothetical protein
VSKRICTWAIALATAAMLCAAASPAAAEQSRAVLSVTAIVAPTCQVIHRPQAQPAPQVACSTGAGFSTMTSARRGEQPLERATTILGAPVRNAAGISFTSAHQPADGGGDAAAAPATQYLTISY